MNTKLVALCATVLSTASVAVAVTAPRTPPVVRSLPLLEAERHKAGISPRGGTGGLTREALAQQRAAVSTRSSIFLLEGVTAERVDLPITGTRARIAVASATDRDLDVRLDSPAGVELPMTAFGRTDAAEPGEASKVVRGRGDRGRGALVVSDEREVEPGTYSLVVRRSGSPVDVYVNDAGGPELVLGLSETLCDDRQPVTLNAELRDADGPLTGAEVTARVGAGVNLRLAESEPGRYSVVVVPSELGVSGTVRFSVKAEGTTRTGLRLLRDGAVDLIVGRARAEVLGVGSEELTATDIVVPVRVRVTAPGRFHARANLLGPGGEPVAWAQDARELPVGEHVLNLRFDRATCGEREHVSDFSLTDLRVMDVTAMPGITVPGSST